MSIKIIRSGGQSGVDRGALDAARENNIEIKGWCPKGGWAEDFPDLPGLLEEYPELKETPSKDVSQRTEWNVRDSDATLIITFGDIEKSSGTAYTYKCCEKHKKPVFISKDGNIKEIKNWLEELGGDLELNVAGPRESGSPGIYKKTKKLINEILK